MELIADGLLILAATVASLYCLVLSRRLRRLNRLDDGLGGAIASLSSQVDEMRNALSEAKQATERSKRDLEVRTKRAEQAAGRLEVLLAAVQESKQAEKAAPTPPPEDPVETVATDPAEAFGEVEETAPVAEPEPEPVEAAELPALEESEMATPEEEDAPVSSPPVPEDDDELRLADALAGKGSLDDDAGSGISSELLQALDKMAAGGSK